MGVAYINGLWIARSADHDLLMKVDSMKEGVDSIKLLEDADRQDGLYVDNQYCVIRIRNNNLLKAERMCKEAIDCIV